MNGPRPLSLAETRENYNRAVRRWGALDCAMTLFSGGADLRACMIAGEVLDAARMALKNRMEQVGADAQSAMETAWAFEADGKFAEAAVWRREADALREEAYLVSHPEERS